MLKWGWKTCLCGGLGFGELTDDVAPFREGIDFDLHLTNFEERYKEFKYSGDGLLRLIKLDFGLRDDYEDLN